MCLLIFLFGRLSEPSRNEPRSPFFKRLLVVGEFEIKDSLAVTVTAQSEPGGNLGWKRGPANIRKPPQRINIPREAGSSSPIDRPR